MRREALLRELVAGGALTDPAWRAAFEAVPRELFVPSYFVGTSRGHERRWGEDPDPRARERWLDGCYEDVALATRLRDSELISSSSQPSLMARMLEALEVGDGMTVLEIGTGTGWNAALLSHRLGDEQVTTVDLDPEITEPARAHLARAGYRPTVVTGDGARGCPARAPYDRIIATCGLNTIPQTWIEQSAPGGLILAPLATGLIRLRVPDGTYGEGHFLQTPAYFVPLRGGLPEHEPPLHTHGVPRHAIREESFRFLLVLAAGRLDPLEAYEMWRHEGRPPRERYGVTVRASSQWAWLDTPDGPYRWQLCPA
ncbi:methyltransferase domain-containing protein [Streptomyces gobiensis]|uniref:methyltransferase domain-containing protein n=1 Tax=Streptomyces gobiensis TaxID=2875706 RepID=UPI001E442393|nr:methyltransferase domain-containing protein [Streptomyces gobiensis]UGY91452.1 methyltransferase domain-containing protein [Streptomyces gobiensis]